MLKIIVKGSGIIPRGHGLAPKLTPFAAEKNLIGLIINTPGLTVFHVETEKNNALKELTRENYQKIYMETNNKIPEVIIPKTQPVMPPIKTTPPVPTKPSVVVPPVEEIKTEEPNLTTEVTPKEKIEANNRPNVNNNNHNRK